MARKKEPDKGPSQAYLISFGDTMTTLLAFFIVLCSMAEDQTGANLYSGTGSFLAAVSGTGLPGMYSQNKSERAMQMQETSPLYMADIPEDAEPDSNGTGPDDDNSIRSVDREMEEFKRFLNELERKSNVDADPATTGEVVFDFFEPLNAEPPTLPPQYDEIVAQFIPLLRRSTHRVDIVVWTPTPSPTAWARSSELAFRVKQELVKRNRLNPQQASRLSATSRPWFDRDAKRPIISVIMKRVENVAGGVEN